MVQTERSASSVVKQHAFPVKPQAVVKHIPQDCNFVLYNGNYTTKAPSSGFTAFATGTNGRGSGFCRAVVSSTNGGSFQVCSGSRAAQMWFSHP